MKKLIICLVCLACASCVSGPKAFIQGDIRIVPPIIQEGYNKDTGVYTITYFNDGGTKWIKLMDAKGKKFDIFIDHRISVTSSGEFQTEPGTIYLNAYPARSNAVLVVDQEGFKNNVLKGIKY